MWQIYIVELKIYWERNVREHDENGGRAAATRKYRCISNSESDFSKTKDMSYTEANTKKNSEIKKCAISSSTSVNPSLFETDKL